MVTLHQRKSGRGLAFRLSGTISRSRRRLASASRCGLATLRVNDVPQFQYDKFNLNYAPRKGDDIDLLDQLGEQRWEVVTINPASHCS